MVESKPIQTVYHKDPTDSHNYAMEFKVEHLVEKLWPDLPIEEQRERIAEVLCKLGAESYVHIPEKRAYCRAVGALGSYTYEGKLEGEIGISIQTLPLVLWLIQTHFNEYEDPMAKDEAA